MVQTTNTQVCPNYQNEQMKNLGKKKKKAMQREREREREREYLHVLKKKPILYLVIIIFIKFKREKSKFIPKKGSNLNFSIKVYGNPYLMGKKFIAHNYARHYLVLQLIEGITIALLQHSFFFFFYFFFFFKIVTQ